MSSPDIIIKTQAYRKIALHSLKYITEDITGINSLSNLDWIY